MKTGRRKMGLMRRAIAALLIVPFVLLSIVASGTMPNSSGTLMEVVICTGSGFKTITVETGDGPTEEQAHDPCPWASHADSALGPATLLSLASVIAYERDYQSREKTLWHELKPASNIHSRAPPILSV